MRLSAIVAATVSSAAVFTVLGSTPVHAEEQINQLVPQATEQRVEEKIIEVKSGDYLAKIADENQTTYIRIFDANPKIVDPDVIYPGDKLRIPRTEEQLESRTPKEQLATVAQPIKQVATSRVATSAPVASATVSGDVWDRLARCESGGNWSINTGNGYYGGLQFSLGSWHAVGGVGYPHQASREEQIARGKMLQARQGWGAWPACTRKLGIR